MTITATEKKSTKWLRTCQLLVGKNGNGDVSPSNGLLIEELRIKWEFTKTIYRTPNVATIWIYNMNQANETLVRDEFNDIILRGGYQGNTHTFFRGNIKYANFYREGVDRVCELNCGDGDKDFHGSLVNFPLSAGHDDAQVIKQILGALRATTKGHVHGKKIHDKHGRGRVISGNFRDAMDAIALDNDAHWSIQDGKLTMVPVDSTLPNEAIMVSSETGLLGAPEVNDKGIGINMMFDPRIVPGGKLWLLNNEVKMKHLKAAITGQKRKLHGPAQPVRMDKDGIYKVYAVHGKGDTRGTEWTSECKCVSLESPIPSAKGMPQSTAPDGEVL